MASACVNNIGMSPENFPAPSYPTYGWLSPTRVSFTPDDDYSKSSAAAFRRQPPPPPPQQQEEDTNLAKPLQVDNPADANADPDPEPSCGDFEFCLEDPVAMLPADELFSDGKLVPLQVSVLKPAARAVASTEVNSLDLAERRRSSDMSAMDLYLSSPKAPRCSSRWRELLGLKKLSQNANAKAPAESTASRRNSTSSSSSNPKSFKNFLHRSSKASSFSDSNLNMPLLKDLDSDSVMISSRLSLSSSSSGGHEHEDLPRLSLDSDKPYSISLHKNPNVTNVPRMRLVKPRADNPKPAADNSTANRVGQSPVRRTPVESGGLTPRGVSVDSPRMNSSGKVIFQSLERSSSSPSSFNGGPRFMHRGMERSYSAGVRVTPVLNVPVSSLIGSSKSGSVFGFGPLFSSSPQKREANGNGTGSTRGHSHHHHHQHNGSRNNRTDHRT
ncbi:uncharacterized protein LOC116192338 [Punica granatum]|uniref:Uncharacterized protein n=2 Tax=Punica granatum TaxID=22663 RepID=A0A218X8P7_PUNGR|nr:uncharacterized protein LOC116192338 [Punica granatum]OWM81046.1 hypothetical protein CDL15_Pgr007077 [Punica granatum]PKI47673.1 hypothetical protein CRG98_031959 [Punica granatum]